MSDEAYHQLADALNKLPNGFPRLESGIEIRILKKIFEPEEAWLAGQLTRRMEPVDAIAERVGLPEREALRRLKSMRSRGLIWGDIHDGRRRFRLAPFIVGIYEANLERIDQEFAQLFEEYWAQGGAKGLMSPQPALHRVVPAQDTASVEWILPYDDVRVLLEAAQTFGVRDCICRVQRHEIGKACDAPVHNCLWFAPMVLPGAPGTISKEEALAILDEAEEAALVHSVSNVERGVWYVCNCCGCCCGILRGLNELGVEGSVAAANYYAVIDPDACTGCGICIDRCQVGAISDDGGVSVVDRARCIGCGLCVTGCPDDAAHLHLKPEEEIIHPPADFEAWEDARLAYRGMAD